MPWWGRGSRMPKADHLSTFPFYKVKQIQIQIWATQSWSCFYGLRRALIGFCSVLYRQPSLKNVRVDFYDDSYKPYDFWTYKGLFDDDEAHPSPDRYHGEMENLIFRHVWDPIHGEPPWDVHATDQGLRFSNFELIF